MTARAEKDFSKFAPVLEEWVALVREAAHLVDPARPAYDVALEEFEKGMTAARLDEVFTQVGHLRTGCAVLKYLSLAACSSYKSSAVSL